MPHKKYIYGFLLHKSFFIACVIKEMLGRFLGVTVIFWGFVWLVIYGSRKDVDLLNQWVWDWCLFDQDMRVLFLGHKGQILSKIRTLKIGCKA